MSWTFLPVNIFRACCTYVNMPLDLETVGVMLRSSPRSLRHFGSEVECASLGVAAIVAATFSCHLGGRRIRWEIMAGSHPRTVFRVDRSPSPFPRLFRMMGSLRLVSASLLGRKTRSLWWKRCQSI